MFYSRKRQRLLGRMAFLLRRLSRGGTGQDDVWSDRDHPLLRGFFFSTVSRIWNLLLQDVLLLFAGSLESAHSLIWGAHQIWGNVLTVLWQLGGGQPGDFLSVTSFMCQHSNVKRYKVIFTLYAILPLFVVMMTMPNTVIFCDSWSRPINWIRGFSQSPPPQNFKHCSITCGKLYPWEIYNVILADVPPKLGVTERTLCYLIFCLILSETTSVTHIFWFSPNFCLSFVWVHSSLLLLFLYLPISLSIYLPVVDPQSLSFFPSLWASFHLLL